MPESNLMRFLPDPGVKVQRSGNSRVLPVPAEIARGINVDLGDEFDVEVIAGDLVYHRRASGLHIRGEGSDRIGIVDDDDLVVAPQRGSVPSIDWDF